MNKALSVSLADHVPSLVRLLWQLLSQALRCQGINIVATVVCVRCLRQLAFWLIQKVRGVPVLLPFMPEARDCIRCIESQKKARIDRGTNLEKVPVKVILWYITLEKHQLLQANSMHHARA